MEVVIIINISANEKIANLVKQYPIIKDIMNELGFSSITNPLMLQTVGKTMSINMGAKMRKIDFELIKKTFLSYNFILEDLHNE